MHIAVVLGPEVSVADASQMLFAMMPNYGIVLSLRMK